MATFERRRSSPRFSPSKAAAGAALFAVIFASTGGCAGKDRYNPGTPLGTYHVEAKATGNSCGSADAPPDPWNFDVKLSREGSTFYWIQGDAPVGAPLDAQGHLHLTSSAQTTVHAADPAHEIGGCAVMRTDTLDATLAMADGADAGVDGFSGTLVYGFSATDGSDCSDLVVDGATSSNGLTFAALPCEIDLSMTAHR